MSEQEKRRPQPRHHKPELDSIASATEYTGVLPAQREEDMPEENGEEK